MGNLISSEGLQISNLEIIIKAIVFFIFSVHVALAIWVARDVSYRSRNPLFQIIAVTLAIFLPVFGLIIYLLIRPLKPLSEKVLDNFEIFSEAHSCYNCGAFVKEDYKFCPRCGENLFDKCKNDECKKKISKGFENCPYCGKKRVVNKIKS